MSQRRIDVKVGFDCNNRCKFCVQGEKRYEYPDKTTDEVKDLLKTGRQDADEVVLTGGEITVRKDLPELIAYAKELGFRVIQMQTNGRAFASMPYLKKIIEAGATEFSPALHGSTPETHDGLTRAPGAFQQTVKGMMNLKTLNQTVITNSVITRANYQQLPAMAALFVKLGVTQFQFAFVHALGSAAQYFDEIVPRMSEIEPFVKKGLRIGINGGVGVMTEAIPLCFLQGGFEQCAAEWVMLWTKIFDAAWVIDDYTDYRHNEGKLKGPPCKQCALNPVCEGPWREYPEHFGWDEFIPVEKPDKASGDQ